MMFRICQLWAKTPNLLWLCEEGAYTGNRASNTHPTWTGGQYLAVFIPHSLLTFFTQLRSLVESQPQHHGVYPPTNRSAILVPGQTQVLPAQNPSPAATGTSGCGTWCQQPRSQPCSTWYIYIIHCSHGLRRGPGLCVHLDGTTTLPHCYLLHNVYQGLQTTSFSKPLLKFTQ